MVLRTEVIQLLFLFSYQKLVFPDSVIIICLKQTPFGTMAVKM
jgi:hypothetical protein